MISVTGKWALITGASRGVGKELAFFMAARGCHLILHSRKTEHTRSLEQKLREKFCIQTASVEAELSDHHSVAAMLESVDRLNVLVEIVFNNAGVQVGWREPYTETPFEDFPVSFAVNFYAPAFICYHFLPKMVKNNFGRIINTTSGIKDQPEQAAYSASKAALDKFTLDISVKLQSTNVLMNLTDPGWCRTDLGGPQAPNPVESSLPGVAVGAFIDDGKSGRLLHGQDFSGLSLEEAVEKVHNSC
ncbi:SDR family oxidoreductase [Balneolaceae bacterium ANBcel3]|nr:SDR family oxidoreductase [Balneolaceae bacterium ANBcel3]